MQVRALRPLGSWRVASVQDDDVPVGILHKAHVADAAGLYAQDFATGCPNLVDRRVHIRHAKRDPVLVRDERLTLLFREPERERDISRLDFPRRRTR